MTSNGTMFEETTAASDPQPASPKRKTRSDKGKTKVPKGLMQVRFLIEPESGFALHQWMVKEGYGEAAADLSRQLGKHYDELRLATERS